MNIRNFSILFLILIVAATRLIPHPPNFTPIIAMGLFGGAFITQRSLALLFPIIAMFISDVFLGFHSLMLVIYISIILITVVGFILRDKVNVKSVFTATLGSSLFFFISSNFYVWLIGYPKSIAGLVACYTAAIPFFQNQLAGSLIYGAILFGGFAVLQNKINALRADTV